MSGVLAVIGIDLSSPSAEFRFWFGVASIKTAGARGRDPRRVHVDRFRPIEQTTAATRGQPISTNHKRTREFQEHMCRPRS